MSNGKRLSVAGRNFIDAVSLAIQPPYTPAAVAPRPVMPFTIPAMARMLRDVVCSLQRAVDALMVKICGWAMRQKRSDKKSVRFIDALRIRLARPFFDRLACQSFLKEMTGGADRGRTGGLMNAIHALCQLSYSPPRNLILLG